MTRRIEQTAALLLTAISVASAQSRPQVQARAVADSFYQAIYDARWEAAAARLDMAEFGMFFKRRKEELRRPPTPTPMTVERMMAHDPTMPRAVAEWQVAQMSQSVSDPWSDLGYEFARVVTLQDLLSLTPEQAAARWLEAKDVRYEVYRLWKGQGCTDPLPAPTVEREQIRAVALEGDSIAYVIHSPPTQPMSGMAPGPVVSTPVSLLVLHRRQGSWKINLDSMEPGNGSGGLYSLGACNSPRDSAARRARAPEMMKESLATIRTAQEIFFNDRNRYADTIGQLVSLHLPEDLTVKAIVLSPDKTSYQITVTSKTLPGVVCGMFVGRAFKNPVNETAGEGEPICKPER